MPFRSLRRLAYRILNYLSDEPPPPPFLPNSMYSKYLDENKQHPDQDWVDVTRDALSTHDMVLRELRSGGRFLIQRGDRLEEFPFPHITITRPPHKPAGPPFPFRVVGGGRL